MTLVNYTPPSYVPRTKKSKTVTRACTACGGPDLVKRDTEHGHALWCPYFNARVRQTLAQGDK